MRADLYLIASIGGLLIAGIGIVEQAVYLRLSIVDYIAMRDRDATYRFMALSRIITSITLGIIHILVVTSIAIILPSRPVEPTTLAFQLLLIRGIISLLVIIGTTANFVARDRASNFVRRRRP